MFRLLLAAPWQWRKNDSSLWALRLYGGLLALLLLAPSVVVLLWMPLQAGVWFIGAFIFLALALCWGVHIGAMLRLDHPHAAHLVPGHSRALREVTLGLWLALVACCGVVAALGAWLLVGTGFRAGLNAGLAVVAGAATLLFLLALAMRWAWLRLPLSLALAFMGVPVWGHFVVACSAWLRQLWLAQPLLLALGVVLLQGLLLPLVFGRGDGPHARAYASRERLRKIAAAGAVGNRPALAAYGRWGELLGLPWQRLADAWLAHVCRHARPTPRSVMARAEVVLHGAQHWVRFISTALLVQLLVALCLVLTTQLADVSLGVLLNAGHVGIIIGLTSMALGAVMSLPGALWHSRREQALLVLLPGMPQGPAQTRALARRQLRHCLWGWAVLLPSLAVMVWVGQWLGVLTYVGLVMPMSAWLWRDASRLQPPRLMSTVLPMLLCLLVSIVPAVLLSRFEGAWLPWLLGLLAVTVGLWAWRWRRMAHLPQALPAGRMG